ncbi:uncharacterized protein LOC143859654 [Tasmannia lanceolata]|uniref:uncharacterized protein LOC143859654 n=1 Tax=Tasmannia lanceolata TaxID=3420 RepID=UPI004064C478
MGATPFALNYRHDLVLPMEIIVQSLKVAVQNDLSTKDYAQPMLTEQENMSEERMKVLDNPHAQRLKMAQSYNKKVRNKTFAENDLVWKTILPFGTKDPAYEKWSPNWEGLLAINKVLKEGAYHHKDLDGRIHNQSINEKFLNPYYPTIWKIMEK